MNHNTVDIININGGACLDYFTIRSVFKSINIDIRRQLSDSNEFFTRKNRGKEWVCYVRKGVRERESEGGEGN